MIKTLKSLIIKNLYPLLKSIFYNHRMGLNVGDFRDYIEKLNF